MQLFDVDLWGPLAQASGLPGSLSVTTPAPDLLQCCTPSWTCGSWSACDCSNQQTRSCDDANQCATSAERPTQVKSCDHCGNGSCDCAEQYSDCSSDCAPAGCTPDWSCTPWPACDCSGQQHRSCTDLNHCNSGAGKPVDQQACDPCEPLPPVGDFSVCGGSTYLNGGGCLNTLYTCSSGATQRATPCSTGCHANQPNGADACNP